MGQPGQYVPLRLALTDDERNARHRQSALEEIIESLDSRLSSVENERKPASNDAPTANGDSSVSLEAALKAVSAALESEHGGTEERIARMNRLTFEL